MYYYQNKMTADRRGRTDPHPRNSAHNRTAANRHSNANNVKIDASNTIRRLWHLHPLYAIITVTDGVRCNRILRRYIYLRRDARHPYHHRTKRRPRYIARNVAMLIIDGKVTINVVVNSYRRNRRPLCIIVVTRISHIIGERRLTRIRHGIIISVIVRRTTRIMNMSTRP